MARLYPTARALCSRAHLLERPCHLGVGVERLQTLTNTSFVACHDELADLFEKSRVVFPGRPRGLEQARELGVDVQRRLAPANQAFAACAQHLADLPLLLRARRRGPALGRERAGRHLEIG